jgi:hypothetical protein
MIQRIQTIYLLVSLICVSIFTFGSNLFYFIGTKIYVFNAFGIFDKEPTADSIVHAKYPIYLLTTVIATLIFATIFSFKNLKLQGKLILLAGGIYSALVIGIVIYFFIHTNPVKAEDTTIQIATGFYLLAMGLLSLILANNGIKRDKKLIDSLNRLR